MAIENIGLFPIAIDIYKKRVGGAIQAHEGDKGGRGLLVTLTNGDEVFDTTGIDLRLAFKDAKGVEKLYDFTPIEPLQGTFKILYPEEMLVGQGGEVVNVEVKAYENLTNQVINYNPLYVYVNKELVSEGDLITTQEGSTIVKMIAEVQTVQDQLLNIDSSLIDNVLIVGSQIVPQEALRVTAENERILKETSRQTKEDTRVTNELDRVSKETVRVTNEGNRTTNESERVSSESTRIGQENTRQINEAERIVSDNQMQSRETIRIDAETTRVINENARLSNESNRSNKESTREINEASRKSQETARQTSETTRVSSEGNRVTNESQRVTAESERVGAETLRLNAEPLRATAETNRVTAETGRVNAETTRAGFYDGFNASLSALTTDVDAQLADIEQAVARLDSNLINLDNEKKFNVSLEIFQGEPRLKIEEVI